MTTSANVLIVEDDLAARQILQDVLEMEGYEVASACNGQEALDWLEQSLAPPKIILLDLMMPVMSGWTFRQLQLNNPRFAQIPTVVMSAYPQSQITAKEKGIYFTEIMQKPFPLTGLLQVVEKFTSL